MTDRLHCPSLLVALTVLFLAPSATAAELLTDDKACRTNLMRLYAAIQDFRRSEHALPKQLSDLIPRYLSKQDQIFCPTVRSSVPENESRQGDSANGSYLYEFCETPLTNDIAEGLGLTQRDLRQWQMGKVGSEIPMIRCTNHFPLLNLSFDGRIYESGETWQERFSRVIDLNSLRLDTLVAEHMHMDVIRIPERPPELRPELIDLTSAYNRSFLEDIEWKDESKRWEVRHLTQGVHFDVRGVVQVGSKHFARLHFPQSVSNILVGVSCRSLVFLHGTISGGSPREPVADYIIHFENGRTETFTIAYGRQLFDSRQVNVSLQDLDANTSVWIADASDAPGRPVVRLYASQWENSRPNARILSFDFVSKMTQSSPFLVAVTAVSEDKPVLNRAGDNPQ